MIPITNHTEQGFETASVLLRYGVAVGAAALATLLTLLLRPLIHTSFFPLFSLAVFVSAWVGGLGPGLLTTALAGLANAYFFLSPSYSLAVTVDGLIKLSVFTLVAVLISIINDRHKRAQEAERAQREYFQVTLASIGDAVIVTDPTGAVTFLNRVAEEVTGWTTADAAGKSLPEVFRIVDEDTRQPVENPVAKVLRTGGVAGLANHTMLIRKDGGTCLIDDSAAPIRDDQGRILGIILVFRDITTRRQAEKALRQSEEKYRTLFDSIDEGFCVIEKVESAAGEPVDFRYVEANPAFAAQSGMSGVVGKTIRQAFLGEPEQWFDTYDAVLSIGEPVRFELGLVTQGRVLDLYAFRVEDDTQRRVAVIFKDITERKRAEEAQAHFMTELQRVNAELEQFARIVSHDLNEPLRTISNYVKLLARRYQGKLDTNADEYIALAVDGAQHMQGLITDLLAYTRVDDRAQEFTAVDGKALLAHVLTDLQMAIADAKAEITHDPLPTVHSDGARLGQVLQNLIGNALKFRGEAAPRIHVSAQRDGIHWRFAVRDNGIGIDPTQTGRLFQVFQRLHTRQEYAGTGIGLAICKKIVEQHGGRIWVESRPGEGSIFYFTISEKSSQESEEQGRRP